MDTVYARLTGDREALYASPPYLMPGVAESSLRRRLEVERAQLDEMRARLEAEQAEIDAVAATLAVPAWKKSVAQFLGLDLAPYEPRARRQASRRAL